MINVSVNKDGLSVSNGKFNIHMDDVKEVSFNEDGMVINDGFFTINSKDDEYVLKELDEMTLLDTCKRGLEECMKTNKRV